MKTTGFQNGLTSLKRTFVLTPFLIFCFSTSSAQETVSSGKTRIHIDNVRITTPGEIPDSTAPVIKIISPDFKTEDKFVCTKPEINILGRITDDISGIDRIFINAEKYELSKDGLFVQNITLKKGENKLNIYAVDKRDNYAELNITLVYNPESSTVTSALNVTGRYFALLIGVNKYDDPNLNNLDYPIGDAENIYNVLVSYYLFDKENITLLRNAKRSDINIALDDLARKITPDDNLLIFYAGHGWWDQNANIGYWLPADANRSYKTEWFRNSTLCDYIREINSKHTLLITDACFGGSIFKTRSVSMEAPKAIQMLYDLPSRKAMTSGTLTEVPDRSSFVKFLIERLNDNKEKCISSEQLFSSFRIAVINNSDAIPQYGEIRNVGDQGGDFIFIRRE
ncbi:MAG: caspase family protein [Bacteroidales bacterium]|nr:caspase family protein [Bacteroidales bacterium]